MDGKHPARTSRPDRFPAAGCFNNSVNLEVVHLSNLITGDEMNLSFASSLPVCLLLATGSFVFADDKPQETTPEVSFYKDVRPILQANCQGCHQPAKSNSAGKYVMTSYDLLIKAGESESAPVVPGKPDDSYLVQLITPENGEAEMPKGKKPLHESEIELVRKWIAQGAKNDTPENADVRYDVNNPPVYVLPPVTTSLDFSPDGTLIAVAGFNEVLLHKVDGSEIVARLIGLAERIESVRFSPDGTRLAIAGGKPGRMGEIQVWDVAKRELLLSHTETYDTLYGASWSPDGTRLAFGCSDNTVRAIKADTGEQVLFNGAHSDWVLDTVWNPAGDHVISVSRDRTAKLTEAATQRFIDNVTSITPGALKGGVATVDTHPTRDEIIVGGADGIPKLFRIFRITNRVIGDNANLIRELEPLRGRVFSVDYSADGHRAVAGSSLDGKGDIVIYDTDIDTSAPADIKAILAKRVMSQNDAEKKKLAEYQKKTLPVIAKIAVEDAGIYAVRFSLDGKHIIAGGSNGMIRRYEAETGKLVNEFLAVPLSTPANAVEQGAALAAKSAIVPAAPLEQLSGTDNLVSITASSTSIELAGAFEKSQLVLTGQLASGDSVDVTRMAVYSVAQPDIITVSNSGLVRVLGQGQTKLSAKVADQTVDIAINVSLADIAPTDYVRDVTPVLSKLGCNAGTCHGSKDGKNGFKLSLRGYDPIYDTRAFTDELASRRANIAAPENSLMLLKATGAVPHVGGQLTKQGEPYYEVIRRWIGGGAKLDLTTARIESISIEPQMPVVQRLGAKQQMRILAKYSDGAVRDVTAESFIESSNRDVAQADGTGLITTERRGESAILARFEGRYAVTTLTTMGIRDGFTWVDPEKWNFIDEHVANKLQRMKIVQSSLCSDEEFVRRIHLDLTGLPPTADNIRNFLADSRDSKTKRYELIDQLVGTDDFIDHWTNKWADLLQVNRKFLAPQGATAFRSWIRAEVAGNTPYNEFAYKVLTAEGSNKDNAAASYFKILRTPQDTMENTTHLWLAIRFNCNKCHDHPFEKWTQDQYYETAAFFAQYGLKADPASGDSRIGGTAVEGAKPLYEVVFDKPNGDITHDRTGAVAPPQFPFDCKFEAPEQATRRQQLAAWITSPDNPYFAKSYVNRVWGYLTGVGLIEPLDDIRAGNPPSNPELLDDLTQKFIESGFNARELMRTICQSRAYQLSIATNEWNADDNRNYSHATPKRLTAEVLYDAIHRVTGSSPAIPGVPAGTRAAQLPDVGVKIPDGFLTNFGRPARESACECERSAGVSLGPIMALVSGPTLGLALADEKNDLTKMVAAETDDQKLISEIFLRVLNRTASKEEIDSVIAAMNSIEKDHKDLGDELAQKETWWVDEKPKRERQRENDIGRATAGLESYQKEIAPRLAELAQQRDASIKSSEDALAKYREVLPQTASKRLADGGDTEWHLLEASTLAAPAEVTLQRLDDRSVQASGAADAGAYTITIDTALTGITGFRIEAIPYSKEKGIGPGIPENGNFVVTEFEVQASPKSKPAELKKITLQNAKAPFLQAGFDIALTTDGNAGNQNAWAIANAGGVIHWATWETKEPVGSAEGTTFKFVIHQNHSAKQHLLGRFRISATTGKPPGLSLPESLKAIAVVAEKERTEPQTKTLMEWFEKTDNRLAGLNAALAEVQRPVPEDPGVTKRKSVLVAVSVPVPDDPQLVRLRTDAGYSEKQIATIRLTAVQDLTWALINTPEFLFNH
jgi:WD40 repeat protein